jgi:hypothetical protein
MSTQNAIANEIRALANGLARQAEELQTYADAVANDPSFAESWADEFAGPANAVQTLQTVTNLVNPRPNATDHFQRVLMSGLGYAQRTRNA